MKAGRSRAAIVIPVHNEEACLAACLDAACTSAKAANLEQDALVVVVLDRCSDSSAEIAKQFAVELVQASVGSVGAARSIGARRAIELGATWLAFTDADTVVAVDWLTAQQSLGAEVVCGTVAVSDWHLYDPQVRAAYETHYVDADGHRHIHGANLGLSTHAYLKCGGFEDMRLHEDVDLVQRLVEAQVSIAWSALPRVSTSARIVNRVPGGFGGCVAEFVRAVEAENACRDSLSA